MDGIGFVVEHANGSHTVRFFDTPDALPDVTPDRTLKLQSGTPAHEHLSTWQHQGRFATGRFVQRSYNYKQPRKLLQGESTAHAGVLALARTSEMEQYAYSENYTSLPDGHRHVSHVMGCDTERYQTATGRGTYRSLQPGRHFSVRQMPEGDWVHAGAEFTLTRVTFMANESIEGSGFQMAFEALPRGEMLYPLSRRSVVASLQTATVTGPAGEELFTDSLGRIKVRFHWDRDTDKPGENATCWLRVMQALAGPGFGAQFTPRIGQEVVVAFENGNPDRPFVLGALYHAEHQPPYASHHGTRSGIRTRSSKGGAASNCNELYFEDATGREELFFQAEKDLNGIIKHDETRRVGNDQTIEIRQNKNERIGNNATQRIAENLVVEAGTSIVLRVGGSAVEITGSRIAVRSAVVDIDGDNVQIN
jgi:type VI secretion system secreted protein VgrG